MYFCNEKEKCHSIHMPEVRLSVANDSIQRKAVDTVHLVTDTTDTAISKPDTLQTVYLTRYQGKEKPSYPHTENWIFVSVLILFLLFVLSVSRSYGWIKLSFNDFWKNKKNKSIYTKTTLDEYQSRVILSFFSLSVISLYIFIGMYPGEPEFSPINFLKILGTSLIFVLLKEFIFNIAGYVFVQKKNLKEAKKIYYEMLALNGFLFFPLLIISIYLPDFNPLLIRQLSWGIIVIISILFIIKLFQIFYRNFLDLFYILLYLCTLEIIPFMVLFKAYDFVLKV